MRVLVTGSSGFLGKEVCSDLSKSGQELRQEEGPDGMDCVVNGSPSPVPLTPFRKYVERFA